MPDPSDRPDPNRPTSADIGLEVDIGAFLPEGSVVAGPDDETPPASGPTVDAVDDDTGWGDDGDEPEVPVWARDDGDQAPARPAPDATGDAAASDDAGAPVPPEIVDVDVDVDAAAVAEVAPAAAGAPATVDVAVLARIEGDLAAVDEALEAVDAGDLGRSPLLVELLGSDVATRSPG